MSSPKERNSWFCKPQELCDSISNYNYPIFSQIIPAKDPCNNLSLNQQEKCQIFSDPILDYISRYLLEEDRDEKITGYEEMALRDMEKPLYDILGEKYPHSADNQIPSSQSKQNHNYTDSISKDEIRPFSESPKQHSTMEKLLATEFQRGVEEGHKFLPNLKKMSIDLQASKISVDPMKNCDSNTLEFRMGETKESGLIWKSKDKRNTNNADLDILEGRNCKILTLSNEETIRDEMFDKVLLSHGKIYSREDISSLRELMKLEANSYSENQNQHNHINLWAQLISCAEAVSMNDSKMASELIQQIRKHASPIGDGIQRLACILVDALEARLAGTGSVVYRQFVVRRVSTTDYLKAFHMGIRAAPIKRVSYHFANANILSIAGDASKIHIVDFGITFGFQWPSLIQALARKKDGPPKLRITGIDLPQPGFHPSQRINETGKRLEDYARSFGVPFEYRAIASQWESICINDLSINDHEVLIVNSMYKLGRVRDEPLLGRNNPMNKLNLIRDAKPKAFIQGIFNLSFSPFFITRFRMVLMQYFRFFDMLETLVPRDYRHRQILERDILGPAIFNQIACEGSDLVVRPENYKQWHTRILQTGFEQLPVDPSVVKECTEIVRNGYNKAFFIEEDLNWFLHGWKGNIIYAISLWKPKAE
jgi:GRAS domain family